MARQLDTKEYLDTVCALLASGQEQVSVPVSGTSMCPFLHPQDTAILEKPGDDPRPGEIYLFVRPTGQYILHRLIRVDPDGTLWMLGDNQLEPEPVAGKQMLRARVTAVRRQGKLCGPDSPVWAFYAGPWRWMRGLRGPVSAVWGKLRQR